MQPFTSLTCRCSDISIVIKSGISIMINIHITISTVARMAWERAKEIPRERGSRKRNDVEWHRKLERETNNNYEAQTKGIKTEEKFFTITAADSTGVAQRCSVLMNTFTLHLCCISSVETGMSQRGRLAVTFLFPLAA